MRQSVITDSLRFKSQLPAYALNIFRVWRKRKIAHVGPRSRIAEGTVAGDPAVISGAAAGFKGPAGIDDGIHFRSRQAEAFYFSSLAVAEIFSPLNEESATVNTELQARIDEMPRDLNTAVLIHGRRLPFA